jgi:5,5'-dehydrodivanillate O-demethylase
MLTKEQNERLTQVGPGTPMGELMRRYWQPITGSSAVNEENPTKEVRLLGEDLVLFRSTAGKLGLVEPSCPHRKANLSYGIPEPEGIRCAYHGWLFDESGNCVDQPSEPAGSRFKEKVRIKAYKVEELGGVVFAYMGPEPAPLLPHWDVLAWEGHKDHWAVTLPCNWLQCQENSLDPLHFQWLHTYWGGWTMNRMKSAEERDGWNSAVGARGAEHRKIGFEITSYGVIKRRLVGDETEESDHWRIGHPILFPNILRVSHGLEFRVPIDDTHTLHLITNFRQYHADEERQVELDIPFEERALYDDEGKLVRDYVVAQDAVAWVIQGPVTDRTTERLGATDVGIIMFRRMLDEQARIVEEGGEPMNVHRDPAENEVIVLPCEFYMYPGYDEVGGPFRDTVAAKPTVEAILSGEGVKRAEWEGITPRARVWGVDTSGLAEGDQAWYSDGKKH